MRTARWGVLCLHRAQRLLVAGLCRLLPAVLPVVSAGSVVCMWGGGKLGLAAYPAGIVVSRARLYVNNTEVLV